MKRKFYDLMLKWKHESNGQTALMIDGARRVGKSYIAELFAKNEYDNYLLIDFSKAKAKVRRYFDEYLEDLDTFFLYLFTEYKVNLPRNRSVIIFDEVQKFPRAREAIKHLVKDGRYHYIETGSLISIVITYRLSKSRAAGTFRMRLWTSSGLGLGRILPKLSCFPRKMWMSRTASRTFRCI